MQQLVDLPERSRPTIALYYHAAQDTRDLWDGSTVLPAGVVTETILAYRADERGSVSPVPFRFEDSNDDAGVPMLHVDERFLPARVTFLRTGLRWQPSYVAVASEDGLQSLSLIATVTNDTEHDATDVRVSLVLGDVSMPRAPGPEMARALVASPVPSDQGGNYGRIPLARTSVRRGSTVFDALAVPLIPPARRFVLVDVPPLSGRCHTAIAYPFSADMYLPAGAVAVYDEEAGEFLGSGSIPGTAPEADALLVLGTPSYVSCDAEVRRSSDGVAHDVDVLLTVISSVAYPVDLLVRYFVGDPEVTKADPPPTAQRDGYVEWIVRVGHGETQVRAALTTEDPQHGH